MIGSVIYRCEELLVSEYDLATASVFFKRNTIGILSVQNCISGYVPTWPSSAKCHHYFPFTMMTERYFPQHIYTPNTLVTFVNILREAGSGKQYPLFVRYDCGHCTNELEEDGGENLGRKDIKAQVLENLSL